MHVAPFFPLTHESKKDVTGHSVSFPWQFICLFFPSTSISTSTTKFAVPFRKLGGLWYQPHIFTGYKFAAHDITWLENSKPFCYIHSTIWALPERARDVSALLISHYSGYEPTFLNPIANRVLVWVHLSPCLNILLTGVICINYSQTLIRWMSEEKQKIHLIGCYPLFFFFFSFGMKLHMNKSQLCKTYINKCYICIILYNIIL